MQPKKQLRSFRAATLATTLRMNGAQRSCLSASVIRHYVTYSSACHSSVTYLPLLTVIELLVGVASQSNTSRSSNHTSTSSPQSAAPHGTTAALSARSWRGVDSEGVATRLHMSRRQWLDCETVGSTSGGGAAMGAAGRYACTVG